MAITSVRKIFTIDDEEAATTVGYQFPARSLNIDCKKIMENLGRGTRGNAADSIFDNDSSCKPSFARRVHLTDILNIPVGGYGDFSTRVDGSGRIPPGTPVVLRLPNKNIHKAYIVPR